MPVIALAGGIFCALEEVAERTAAALDVPCVGGELLARAEKSSGIPVAKLERAMMGPPAFFDAVTHEREKCLIALKLALWETLAVDSLVCHGAAVHLIPEELTHCLRVGVMADRDFRLQRAAKLGIVAATARKEMRRADAELSSWTHFLFRRGPFNPSLYDIKIPVHSTSVDGAVELLVANAAKDALKPTQRSLQLSIDSLLAARVHQALFAAGHHEVEVSAQEGEIAVTINRNVLRVERLARELERVAATVVGVRQAIAKVGPGFNRPNILRADELPVSSKALLVDDEQEFALTLSERLEMRNLGTEVVYDGEQALAYVAQHEPYVMVLDLRMPKLGGMEVLQRIKQDHPRVEVIILTGHGSKADEQRAMELGAFAYLQKPVDINVLARTMQAAEAHARAAHGGTPAPAEPADAPADANGGT